MLEMWDVRDVGCLPGCEMLILKNAKQKVNIRNVFF